MLRSSPPDGPPRGWRALALALAVGVIAESGPAACVHAQAASPFPEVVVEKPPVRSYRWAYVSLASGAALVGSSFLITRQADGAYDAYLRETDPNRIETYYDRAVLYDHFSTVSLVTGEILLIGGLYLRFLRPPAESRVQLAVGPGRCGLSLRF